MRVPPSTFRSRSSPEPLPRARSSAQSFGFYQRKVSSPNTVRCDGAPSPFAVKYDLSFHDQAAQPSWSRSNSARSGRMKPSASGTSPEAKPYPAFVRTKKYRCFDHRLSWRDQGRDCALPAPFKIGSLATKPGIQDPEVPESGYTGKIPSVISKVEFIRKLRHFNFEDYSET